jgi:hypothetical protein
MPKNLPPPICPKCRKPMHFITVRTGGRKFRCIDCVSEEPLPSSAVAKLFTDELQPLEQRAVLEYRMYTIGIDGHFTGSREIVCRDDSEAVAKAKRMVDGHDIEVWAGDRFVIRLNHKSN